MSKKVLVVDDSRTIRPQVKFSLEKAASPYTVVLAEDGQDGLDKLNENQDVGLIVCDVNMPRMGGIEFLGELGKTGQYDQIPVIILTTEGDPDLIEKAKTLGAKAWVKKPFKPPALVSAVSKLIG